MNGCLRSSLKCDYSFFISTKVLAEVFESKTKLDLSHKSFFCFFTSLNVKVLENDSFDLLGVKSYSLDFE